MIFFLDKAAQVQDGHTELQRDLIIRSVKEKKNENQNKENKELR